MKKIIYLGIILLCTTTLFAQGKEVDREFKAQIDPIFDRIDKRQVPHGILLDYAMEFTNVPAYNGTLTDSTLINTNVLGNIYKTLFMGKVTTDTTYFPRMEKYAEKWFENRKNFNSQTQNTIVLSGLHYNYSRINPDALRDKKIEVNNNQYQEVYVNGVWQNPYQELQTFAVAAPIAQFDQNNFSVVLPHELWLSNTTSLEMQVDFNDGSGFQPLHFDVPINVSYPEGQKTHHWIFKTRLGNGSWLFSSTPIRIGSISLTQPTNGINNVFIPYENNVPGFVQSGAVLRIDYAAADGILRRPFIVAEGFDPGSILTPEKIGGDRTLANFIEDIELVSEAGELAILLDDNQQYDIVYVDWQNGTNSIQHNSQVFRNVLNWVNSHKQGSEPNVVLGQSMGGLIGRYTLAKMEKEGKSHNVKLFIAHDSPLQGSNVPLSLQYFTRHAYDTYVEAPILYDTFEYIIPFFSNLLEIMNDVGLDVGNINLPSPEDALTLQDTPAAVQMNYYYVDYGGTPTPDIHNAWQVEFDAMGYPQQCKNIAISNGNECSVDHGFQAHDKFINLHDTLSPDGYSWIAGCLLSSAAGFALGDIELMFLSLLPGSNSFKFDFDLYSNPALGNSDRKVYRGKITYKKKIIGIFPVTHTITERTKHCPNAYLPFDIYSGGEYDITIATNNLPIGLSPSFFINKSYGFIPVVSSLDIRRNNGTVLETDYYNKYSGGILPDPALSTKFDNFIVGYDVGLYRNYGHITFQARNGNWLARVLTESTLPASPNCSFICGTTEISGAEIICTNGTFTVPAGAVSYTWSIVGSSASKSSSGNTATLTRVGQLSGSVLLRVVIDGGDCGSRTLEKNVWVGVPIFNNLSPVGNQSSYNPNEPSISVSEGSDACNQIRLKANFDSPSILEYQWEKITTDVTWGVNASSGHISLMPQCNKNFIFKVRARNICGWSDWKQLEFYMNRCTIDCSATPPNNGVVGTNFILSPNPVTNNNMLDIAIKNTSPWFYPPATIDPNTGLPIPPPLTIKKVNISIYGSSMNLLQSYTNKTVPTQLDISTLPQGSYLVIFEHFGLFENYTIIKG